MSVDQITIHNPVDAHVHFRQGSLLEAAAPLTAASFSAALVMPNIEPPARDWRALTDYSRQVRNALHDYPGFEPLFLGYFDLNWTRDDLIGLRSPSLWRQWMVAAKFYPRDLTTNSHHGCDPNDPGVDRVLALLEEMGIPLCVHAEYPGYHEDREALFQPILWDWSEGFPDLRIVVEHISSRLSLQVVARRPNVYGTVTPHHLLLTGDDLMGPPLRPHLYCMPVLKRPEDRDDLVAAVTGSRYGIADKLMLGTDSAPHPVSGKEGAECCAGCFTAPIALQLVADVFDRAGAMGRLQAFCSDNARQFYRTGVPEKNVTLVRRPFLVPDRYADAVVPLFAGQEIPWSILR